jgi:hypothetical protein
VCIVKLYYFFVAIVIIEHALEHELLFISNQNIGGDSPHPQQQIKLTSMCGKLMKL